jgi:hypothetical protein
MLHEAEIRLPIAVRTMLQLAQRGLELPQKCRRPTTLIYVLNKRFGWDDRNTNRVTHQITRILQSCDQITRCALWLSLHHGLSFGFLLTRGGQFKRCANGEWGG